MEPEGLLLRLQEPATCPYPEPDQSSACPPPPPIPLPADLGRTKGSVQAWGTCIHFAGRPVFTVRRCQHLAQHQSWITHPLSPVRDCLFSIFAATLHIGGRSSVRNLRTHHAVVARTHLSRIYYYLYITYIFCILCIFLYVGSNLIAVSVV
jgi:hypothetical protein